MAKFIEIHAIHSVPPSNLNRDDNGSPKSAFVGGVKRHRVSSQSWKKAIRDYFRENYSNTNLGHRTKNVGDILISKIVAIDPSISEEEAKTKAVSALKLLNIIGEKRAAAGETTADALFLVSDAQLEAVARDIVEFKDDEKELKKNLKVSIATHNSLDLALFGRMVAGDKDLSLESAAQFAHAFSTHEVNPEFDFFTAVDDFSVQDHAGAGMMGDIEFTSSTLYRFATINLTALSTQFGNDGESVADGVARFIGAFIKSLPSGKQNSFAALTLPEAVLITIREGQTVSLANAFEKPVQGGTEGYSEASISRLVETVKSKNDAYGDEGKSYAVALSDSAKEKLSEIAEVVNLTAVLESIKTELN